VPLDERGQPEFPECSFDPVKALGNKLGSRVGLRLAVILSNRRQFFFDSFPRLGEGEANMSLSEKVGPLLAARADTDPDAAKLLEMFTKAEKMLNESLLGHVETSKLFSASTDRQSGQHGH
jgi:hypothetical protein